MKSAGRKESLENQHSSAEQAGRVYHRVQTTLPKGQERHQNPIIIKV